MSGSTLEIEAELDIRAGLGSAGERVTSDETSPTVLTSVGASAFDCDGSGTRPLVGLGL